MNEYKNKFGEIIDLKDVTEKYFSNWKINDIAKQYNCSWQQIGKIIWKEIPSRRVRKYKYDIDHNYFNNINNEKKAYIIGFLCADGCISKKCDSELSIGLQSRDISILEFIKSELESNSPIDFYFYKNKEYCRISFYSKQICDDLKSIGCGPLKSKNLIWIGDNLPSNLISHFIRGYFDGDGHFSFWMYKKKYLKAHFNITSTLKFCEGLSNFIHNIFGYKFYMSKRNKQSLTDNRTIELSGNKQIITILNWIYNNSTIFLKRKKEAFDEFIKIYEQ